MYHRRHGGEEDEEREEERGYLCSVSHKEGEIKDSKRSWKWTTARKRQMPKQVCKPIQFIMYLKWWCNKYIYIYLYINIYIYKCKKTATYYIKTFAPCKMLVQCCPWQMTHNKTTLQRWRNHKTSTIGCFIVLLEHNATLYNCVPEMEKKKTRNKSHTHKNINDRMRKDSLTWPSSLSLSLSRSLSLALSLSLSHSLVHPLSLSLSLSPTLLSLLLPLWLFGSRSSGPIHRSAWDRSGERIWRMGKGA